MRTADTRTTDQMTLYTLHGSRRHDGYVTLKKKKKRASNILIFRAGRSDRGAFGRIRVVTFEYVKNENA